MPSARIADAYQGASTMNGKGLAGVAAMFALGWGMNANAAPRSHMVSMINDIDSRFVCPETLPSDADRSAALTSFAKKLASNNVTYTQATRILNLMLRRHNCSATVAGSAPIAEAPSEAVTSSLSNPVVTVASIAPAR